MYVNSMVASVPNDKKDSYIKHAKAASAIMKEHGALRALDAWGENVPEGKNTSFPMAVQKKDDETVLVSWVEWESKEASEKGMEAFMNDPRTANLEMPFDGQRLIWGGFDVIVDG